MDEPFKCENCGEDVAEHPAGSCRNHCPKCLFSKHVDERIPGDRASDCQGLMEPIAVEHTGPKGEMILFRCQKCEREGKNKVAPDDSREQLEKIARDST